MSEVTAAPTLEERITTRIREQLGDLMTDDDLRGIVARGVKKALFEERLRPGDYGRTIKLPSIVDEVVESHLAVQMREAVSKWLDENPDEIRAALERTFAAGVGDALLRALDSRFSGLFDMGIVGLQNRGMLPRP